MMTRFHLLFSTTVLTLVLLGCTQEQSGTAPTESSGPSDPIFELISPDNSGLVFANSITESFENNILINSYLYNGGGVAVLDANADGLPDLYLTATQDANRLFINRGNLEFEDITETAGVATPVGIKTGVSIVDINGDGYDDIYVCKSGMTPDGPRANHLFINNGDLTFTDQAAQYGLDDRSASNQANFFDYDLDGDLDVYVMNHPVAFKDVNRIRLVEIDGQRVRQPEPDDEWESDKLFRNNGNGTFTNVSDQAGISNRGWGLSVTTTDFNRDGYPDIFVGNDFIEPDYLYINQGNGTFVDECESYFAHTSNHTMGVDIADINNDELVDIVALDMIAEDNRRQKELMTTMVLDRYSTLVQYEYGHQVMRNTLQINTGREPGSGEVFADIGVMAGVSNTDWSWSPLIVDLDNDGFKDLYITNGYRRDISNLDYLNYTVDSIMRMGGLGPHVFDSVEQYLALIPTTPLRNYLYKNVDGLRFEDVTAAWGADDRSYANGSAYADLDADGDIELIVNQIDGDVLLYENLARDKGKGNWLQVALEGPAANKYGTGSKIRIQFENGDPQYFEMTPVRGFLSCSEPIVHAGVGSQSGPATVEVQWPDGRYQKISGVTPGQRLTVSYDNAGRSEWVDARDRVNAGLSRSDLGIDFVHTENPFIDFNRERLLPLTYSNLGPYFTKGDVNGDGLEDVFVGGARGQSGALFVQGSNSRFTKSEGQPWEADANFEDMGSAFVDAEGDGDLDLFISSGGSSLKAGSALYRDRLYLNDGSGKFSPSPGNTLPSAYVAASCVATHDMNGDGNTDILVGGLVTPGRFPENPPTCYLQNKGGRFEEVCSELAPELSTLGHISDFEWADLNGDGSDELIVSGEWIPISIFENQGGRLENVTEKWGLARSNGWWNSITTADLDGDGDLDLVGGNLGLNSRLKATEDEPLLLYVNDFDDNGSIDPIMAYYNAGKVYPLAQRNDIIKQLPHLKKKYVFHRDYGDATLEEVFPKRDLDASDVYRVNTFATSWFENDNGRLVQHALPFAAQVSPVHAVLIEDLDSDGHADLLLLGNSSRSDVETGRYDASQGTVLLNDGAGTFKYLPNWKTNLWIGGEVRNIVTVELANGQRAVLMGKNNSEVETYIVGD